MLGAGTIAATLGTIAAIAVADDQGSSCHPQDLLDQGFAVIAEGQLFENFQCAPALAGITLQEIRQGRSSGTPQYGSFKRLKSDRTEFVCVSFRDWACYPSSNSNER
jgi:hypothetical protein